MSLPVYLTRQEVCEWMKWSMTTLWRRVSAGCFPQYELSDGDVRFKPEDIIYWLEGKKRGNFDGIPLGRKKS